MRQFYFILLLFFLPFSSNADIVIIEASGDSFDSALENAKKIAIENQSGVLINQNKRYSSENDKYEENINQITNAFIKSYKILSFSDNKIKVEFDIQKTKLSLKQDGGEINQKEVADIIESFESQYRQLKYLNNLQKALSAKVVSTDISLISTDISNLSIKIKLSWDPQWINEMVHTHEIIERDQSYYKKYELNDKFKESIVQGLFKVEPILAGIASLVLSGKSQKESNTKQLCIRLNQLDSTGSCFSNKVFFSNIPDYSSFAIKLISKNNDGKVIAENKMDIGRHDLYKQYYKNDTAKDFLIFKKRFNQPAVVINASNVSYANFSFNIDNKKLKNISTFDVVPQNVFPIFQ